VVPYPESVRDALPKDESYPVGREGFDAALMDAGVENVDLVYFLRSGIREWHSTRSGELLRIDFRAATGERGKRVEVRVHAVPAELRRTLEAALVPEVVARAAAWIRRAETSENVWRSADHAFAVRWDGTALLIEDR